MTNYPIVKVKTADGVILHGLLVEPKTSSNSIVISIHGTAGSFYWNDFYEPMSSMYSSLDYAFLTTNNRGAGVYEIEKGSSYCGASIEKFEDCLLDIDSWIGLALSRGYDNIILQGHSFGTEKCVYYMNSGKYKDKVKAVILLGFSDTVGTQKKYEATIGRDYMEEAKKLVAEGKDFYLLSDIFGLAGELPITAKTYLNFYATGSELSQVLPFRQGKNLDMFKNIHVPVLGVIGDKDAEEYTIIPIKDAIELLKAENPNSQIYQISNCGHGFEGREAELVAIVKTFLAGTS